jgi:hypothetical protein
MNDFLEKIELERNVLRAVNAHFDEPFLNGVNEIAIATWVYGRQPHRAHLAPLLARIAVLLSSVVERSGQKERLRENARTSVEVLVAELLRSVQEGDRGVA